MKFELYLANGQYKWRLRDLGGNIIETSGNCYDSLDECLKVVKMLKSAGKFDAPVEII